MSSCLRFFVFGLVMLGLRALPSRAEQSLPVAPECRERAAKLAPIYEDIFQRKPGVNEAIVEILSRAVSAGRIPGGAVAYGSAHSRISQIQQGRLFKGSSDKVKLTTLYDLASISKVVGTATSIMILRERGALTTETRVQDVLPEFLGSPVGEITVEELLRHHSGLTDVSMPTGATPEERRRAYLLRLARLGWAGNAGSKQQGFKYTDANYILLGEIVARVSGLPLDQFVKENVFEPLQMKHSTYFPIAAADATAVTEVGRECARALRTCEVHDPKAYALGGVAGSAGIFSTAEDLARFAQMILQRGRYWDPSGVEQRLLSEESVRLMTTDPVHHDNQRGMGFDVRTLYSCASRGVFDVGASVGHTGYTGTSLWIDFKANAFVVLLTNEVDIAKGPVDPVRFGVARAVAVKKL